MPLLASGHEGRVPLGVRNRGICARFKQVTHNRVCPTMGGKVKRSPPSAVDAIRIGTMTKQQRNRLSLIAGDCCMERSIAQEIVRDRVRIGAVTEQYLHDFKSAKMCGQSKCRPAIATVGAD